MKVHITKIYNQLGTQGLAQSKIAAVAKQMGFSELGIYRYPCEVDNDLELGKRIDGILASVQFGDIVFIQSPSWIGLRYDLRFIRKVKAYMGVKIAVFVHDVIPLAFNSGEENLRATIEIYNYADLIIVPSEAMLQLLRQHGLTVKKTMVQKIWDYPVDFELNRPEFHKRIFFTGAPSRFSFVNSWRYETELVVYTGDAYDATGLNISLRPYQMETILLSELSEGGYGLVWPSDESNEYYQLIQPYKIGSFLAAGIPIILKKGLSTEQVIMENGLGFVVDSLEEANARIQATSEDEYNKMVQRIAEYNFLTKNGWHTRKMLTDAIMMLLEK